MQTNANPVTRVFSFSGNRPDDSFLLAEFYQFGIFEEVLTEDGLHALEENSGVWMEIEFASKHYGLQKVQVTAVEKIGNNLFRIQHAAGFATINLANNESGFAILKNKDRLARLVACDPRFTDPRLVPET